MYRETERKNVNFLSKLFHRSKAPNVVQALDALRVPCQADLWCRKRTSISTMLDPDLFALYMTGDDRIDEDWVVQSNPPCAFKAEFKEGCDTLLELLQMDPGLHATKGWLYFIPPVERPDETTQASFLKKMSIVARAAERELKTGI
jgi:hypothetical protein